MYLQFYLEQLGYSNIPNFLIKYLKTPSLLRLKKVGYFCGMDYASNDDITYLPAPPPAPTGCDADCEAAIRSYLPVGTTSVDINAGGQTVAQGTILKSEYGMVVVVVNDNSNPTFVSLCKAEIINK